MNTVIKVEDLSKNYMLHHYQRERYTALRDVIARSIKNFGKKIISPKSSSQALRTEEFWALKDVSFDIQQGDSVGIIGHNGAGKSTLLKILSRITDPSGGKVSIKGRVASLLEVGTGFHPELTGSENIFLNGAILGMNRVEIKKKFDEIVAFAEIERFLDTPVKRYSSGMYVRLAFAVAAHLEPEILLVDEVLAVGDMEFRKKCLGKMQEVGEVGRTVLFVSHDMGNIFNLCLKTIWLDSGKIQAFGDTKDVISQYVSSGESIGGEICWADIEAAPGNDNVRLKAVRIKSNGHATADVMIDSEVRIEIDYWNLQDGAVLVSNMYLWDKMNALVLASLNLPSASLSLDPWAERPHPTGLYRTVCVIPANFLNSENYSIGVGIQNRSLEWQAWEKNILKFVVHETGEMKKEYMGPWAGVIRPKLDWSTVCLNGDGTD